MSLLKKTFKTLGLSLSLLSFIFLIGFLWIKPTQARDWDPRIFKVYELAYSGDYLAAEKIADTLLKEDPKDPNAYFVRSTVYEWERNLGPVRGDVALKKSLKLLEKANRIAYQNWYRDQNNVDRLIDVGNSFILLGRLYAENGSGMRAVLTAKKGPKYIEKALKKDPSRTDGLMTLGIFNYVADKTPSGLSALKGFFGIKGNAALGLKQLNQAIASQDPYKHDALAALFYMQKSFEKNYPLALQTLGRLQNQFPENPQWMEARASVMEKQSKAKGEQGFLEMIEWCQQKENRCANRLVANAYFHVGRLAKDQGKYAQAKESFSNGLKIGLNHRPRWQAETLLWLGQSEVKLGQCASAKTHFKSVAKVSDAPKDLKRQAAGELQKNCN